MSGRLAWRGMALLVLALGLLIAPIGAGTVAADVTTTKPPRGPAPHAVSPSATGITCTPGISCVISSSGGTLDRIVVGADTTAQVVYPSLSATDGQVYPPDAGISDNCSADNGVWVLIGSTLYGPNFSSSIHCDGSATGAVSPNTFFTPVSQTSGGSGTNASPFTVTTVVSLGSGMNLTQIVYYVPGDKFYRQTVTLTGNGSPARIYHGADIFLFGSDNGFGFRDAPSGAVGGQNCVNGQPGTFFEVLTPATAAQHYVEAGYSTVWSDINAGKNGTSLPNSIISGSCIDNGAALEWDNVSSGTPITDAMSFSLGSVVIPPTPTPPSGPTSTPVPGATPTPNPIPDFPTPLSGVLASLGAAGVYGWLRLRTSGIGRRRR